MKKLLIVDDNEANRGMLRTLLEGAGYAVAEAANGSQALDLALEDAPDAVVADLLMPEMDGFTLCHRWMRDTGLGLATVYGVVTQCGGFIWPYSEPGKGTTFRIFLPRVDKPLAGKERAETVAGRGRGETILVVEDEGMVRNLASRILGLAGYKVLAAANGGEALLVAERHPGPIELLLTDVVMPGMSGKELADRLAGLRPGMKVVFASGYPDDQLFHHGMLEPGLTLIQKPYTMNNLASAVRTALDKRAGGY